jgi:uncharacterized membrane protein YkoI
MSMMLTVLIAVAAGLAGDEEALLKKAAYPLPEAIQKATAVAKEGVVVSAELDEVDGKAVYIVEFAHEGKVIEVTLDAATGDLLTKVSEEDDKSDVVKACKITLSKGIAVALEKVSGKLLKAEAELESQKAVIEVKIFADGKAHKVKVDAVTGEVLSVKSKKS